MPQQHDQLDKVEAEQSPAPHSFSRRVAIVYGIGLLFILAITFVWVAAEVLLLVFAASLVAVLLNAATRFLVVYLHLPRGLALGIVLAALISSLALGGYFLAPRISGQIDQLSTTIPRALKVFEDYLASSSWGQTVLEQVPAPQEMLNNASEVLMQARMLFSGAFGALVNFIIILFVGMYLAAQPRLYINGILRLLPKKKRARGEEVIAELGRTMELWLLGKFISMTVVGSMGALGLWLLDVPLAITLGLLAGLLDFIPYIGPILAGIPALLIAFSESPLTALYVLLLFILLQLMEGYLISPLVERKTVSLPPAITISMQVTLGLFFGLMGVALASPLAASLFVLITMLYVQDTLHDPVKTPSEH